MAPTKKRRERTAEEKRATWMAVRKTLLRVPVYPGSIRAALRARGATLSGLRQEAGLTSTTLYNYLQTGSRPHFEALRKLHAAVREISWEGLARESIATEQLRVALIKDPLANLQVVMTCGKCGTDLAQGEEDYCVPCDSYPFTPNPQGESP